MTMEKVSPKDVEKCLKGIDYPVDKKELIRHADEHGADERIHKALERMLEQTYNSPVEVNKAIGQVDRGKGNI